MNELFALFCIVIGVCGLAIAITEEGAEIRRRFFGLWKRPSAEDKLNREAELARVKVLNSYYREYLSYGYDEYTAKHKAENRLENEAKQAENVK